jgi:hypothetical protein
MGRCTSLGLSLVAGLANVRLGYWWDSGVNPRERRTRGRLRRVVAWLFPFQSYLLSEWLARFHGPARRHWYLSDGGHFENTGVYELLRRRLPHVICCDCGADPEYGFGDLASLVRKARIDFEAEVRFVSAEQLRKLPVQAWPASFLAQLGMPQDFADPKRRATGAQPHALLAVVRFGEPPAAEAFALILFLKPALSGDEPLDLWEYHAQQPDFPQDSTADQFFDEAQWESYRKLGEHTAAQILARVPAQPFWFTELDPAVVWHHAR